MDADELELGEIAGDGVERRRLADADGAVIRRVDHRLSDLHLDRHAELRALGVERVVLPVVGRQLEPVRVEVRADEAELHHRVFELAHAV